MLRRLALGLLIPLAITCFTNSRAAAQQSSDVVAVVNGDRLTESDLQRKEENHLLQAQYQYYQSERKALDDLIDQHLLEKEAQRQGLSVDQLLKREVDDQVKDPTEEQLQVYYEGLDSKDPYDSVRGKILDHIRESRRAKKRALLIDSLRTKANIVIELAPPVAQVSAESAAVVEGRADAPVQLVEFADYQCPYCQRVNPDMNKLLDEFKGKLAIVYKDFPLPMHHNAEKAAEAARCAGEQGKFWEYHNLLFSDKKLEVSDLKQEAKNLHLDGIKFDSCLDSGSQASVVQKNRDEGMTLGLTGTPSFFVNGHFFSGAADYTELHDMVEQQLNVLVSAARQPSPTER